MNKKILITAICLVGFTQSTWAEMKVRIKQISGDVKIRRGVEESWFPAGPGTWLDEIDSILTGEGQAVLEVEDGKTFRLGSNAILDIADLRRITEQELFLLLMSKKIQNMESRQEKTRLRIGDINVLHGEQKTDSLVGAESGGISRLWELEKNGARALYLQDYKANAILKWDKILAKYPQRDDCGEVHFYLGKAFEDLEKPGQAIDAYQRVLKAESDAGCEKTNRKQWVREAEHAIQTLRN